jgi:hypothetical protein
VSSRVARILAILDAPIGPELDAAVDAANDVERRDACELIELDLELLHAHLAVLLDREVELLAAWPMLAKADP